MGERVDESATRGVEPISLRNAELEFDTVPLAKTPR